MTIKTILVGVAALAALSLAPQASAETLRSKVAFNTGIGQQTDDQPPGGNKVAYQVKLSGGELDGCTVDAVEALYGRDEGAWGIFDIDGEVKCDRGSFAYTSSGAWDGKGFHGAGTIREGSGSGDFEGISGRVAQLETGASPAGDGTFDISYDLVVDAAGE